MPGIFGLSHLNKDGKSKIESMSRVMQISEYLVKDDLFIDENVAASRVHLGHIGISSSPIVANNIYVWLEGEVYNLKEVSNSMKFSGDNLAMLLVQAYLSNQLDACLAELDGYFCAALYDVKNLKILLISDRYGMRMLYFYYKENQFVWSSDVKGILALPDINNAIDPSSPECFLELGYLLEDHTWFELIKLINPATVIEYDILKCKLNQRQYWSWSSIKPSNISFKQAINELGEIFLQSVARRFNSAERIGISLSGGLDSRAILAAVCMLEPNFKGYAYTFGIPGCSDIKIAQKVVSLTKWSHEIFYFNHNDWFEKRLKNVWYTDGMLDMKHMHGSEFLDEINKHMSINLNGYAGDVVCGGGWLNHLPLNVRATKNNLLEFYKNHIHLCNIENEYYDIKHVEPHLYLNRVRRFTNMGTVNILWKIDQRKPFFDNKIIELMFSLPDEYRQNNKVYSSMLQTVFPKFFRDIPWQKTGKPAGIYPQQYSLLEIGMQKVKRIPFKLGIFKSKQEYTDYQKWIGDVSVLKQIEAIMNQESNFTAKLFSNELKSSFLKSHIHGHTDYSSEILRLITMETYLKKVSKLSL